MPGMHKATLKGSETLRRLLAFLQARGEVGATSIELTQALDLVAVATWVSQLRHNGVNVDCQYERTTETGRRVHRYRVVA